jgi:signal transduction histidine kinase
MAGPLIDSRQHQLEVIAPQRGELVVDGDEARLAQVVANLLTNSAKYTPIGGHIRIHAHRQGGEAVVEVRDDGVGIDRDLLPRVFDLFVQGRQGADRGSGGLGIGLALVRSLVEMHGGSVTAHSDGADRGSVFTVRLRLLDRSAQRRDFTP